MLGERPAGVKVETNGMVFRESGIESIRIPSTVEEIMAGTFYNCKSLRRVEFSEGL